MIFFAYIRSYIQWFLFGCVLTLYVVLIFILGRFLSKDGLEKLLQSFTKHMVLVSGINLHIHGEENIDRSKSYVVMFNHFNFLDHFVIYRALKLRLRGLEKEAHFHWPVYGSLMRLIGIIPIPPRGNTEKALESLRIARSKIEEGVSMLIAPEGTRTVDGKLGTFKKGGFHLAIQTQADILPVVFMGMYQFNHKNTKLITPGRVDLFIEKPIRTQGMKDSDVMRLRDQIRTIYDNYNNED
jgi:1-acyl-sn-glycerol-3-phosphate acyltransferase